METPDVIDLRKQQRKEADRPLYTVSSYFAFYHFLAAKIQVVHTHAVFPHPRSLAAGT